MTLLRDVWPTLFAAAVAVAFLWWFASCGGYRDTVTPAGVPNFHVFAPDMYRTGLPPSPAAWAELRAMVEKPGRHVTKVVLHDAAEGDESPAVNFGWNVVLVPLPPEDDQPLTVFVKPRKSDVDRAVQAILDAHARGDIVVWGCVHDRDRGGIISALVGMKMFGWSKEYAFDYAIKTGLRWELVGLDAYWIDDVSVK